MVWDPWLRAWHWLLAAALTTSLYTGLSDDLALKDLHMWTGQGVLGLLVFRLGWALWGGTHARIGSYWQALHWRSKVSAHSPAGALMAITLWLGLSIQAGTGLFASDDIMTEGPFARRLSDAGVDLATAVHHRAFWLVIALIVGHLLAIAWYGLARRDPLALGMFTGHKTGLPTDASRRLPSGAMTAVGAAAIVYFALRIF